jgi:hypothetical protein
MGKRELIQEKVTSHFNHLGADDIAKNKAYGILYNFDEQSLQDPDITAGLVYCVFWVGGNSLRGGGKMGGFSFSDDIPISETFKMKEEIVRRVKQTAISNATEYYGKGRKNYKEKLEKAFEDFERLEVSFYKMIREAKGPIC